MMSAAVLTISDGAHHGLRVDTSGPAVAARLEEAGFTVVERKIVPDDREQIRRSCVISRTCAWRG